MIDYYWYNIANVFHMPGALEAPSAIFDVCPVIGIKKCFSCQKWKPFPSLLNAIYLLMHTIPYTRSTWRHIKRFTSVLSFAFGVNRRWTSTNMWTNKRSKCANKLKQETVNGFARYSTWTVFFVFFRSCRDGEMIIHSYEAQFIGFFPREWRTRKPKSEQELERETSTLNRSRKCVQYVCACICEDMNALCTYLFEWFISYRLGNSVDWLWKIANKIHSIFSVCVHRRTHSNGKWMVFTFSYILLYASAYSSVPLNEMS